MCAAAAAAVARLRQLFGSADNRFTIHKYVMPVALVCFFSLFFFIHIRCAFGLLLVAVVAAIRVLFVRTRNVSRFTSVAHTKTKIHSKHSFSQRVVVIA